MRFRRASPRQPRRANEGGATVTRRRWLGGSVLVALGIVGVGLGYLMYLNPVSGEETVPAGYARNTSSYIAMRDGIQLAADVWVPERSRGRRETAGDHDQHPILARPRHGTDLPPPGRRGRGACPQPPHGGPVERGRVRPGPGGCSRQWRVDRRAPGGMVRRRGSRHGRGHRVDHLAAMVERRRRGSRRSRTAATRPS